MRRLKENAMLETEISKTGDVIVEGHVIGRLEGFRFAPDASAGGSEAKALSGAAQKALAGEIEARATRLAHAPDSQFVLASDGTIRWIGDAVAKLMAGDNLLRPRVRILADEQLTGAAHEAVQTRLDLWTHTHIERALAPLFVLSAAEDITGLARGIAYQIVEALGVLERGKVADDVKNLDQAARATLRKHGVRFGAYHIYVPALLKPGPRALAAQLWALKNGGPDLTGMDELLRLAASGRTSFRVDKDTNKQLYRTIGYRVCGERAVRVDILERLADLIRPALLWKEGVTSKPAGAFDGRGFTVTQAMTSLTGSSGEDFGSILRALGYRMDRRPRPVETASAPPADARPAEEDAAEQSLAAQETTDPSTADEPGAVAQSEPVETATTAVVEPVAAELESQQEAAVEPQTSEIAASLDEVPTDEAVSVEAQAGEAGLDTAERPPEAEASSVEKPDSAAAAEPEFIEVWRPGRSEERRPRRRRPPRDRIPSETPAQTQAPAPTQATAAAPSPAPHPDGARRDREDRRKPRDAADRGAGRNQEGRREGRDRDRRRDRRDEDRPPRVWEAGRDRRSKEPDPDSPFAKLAALKAQLEAEAKDRH
jgi:ATP-dependent RNA helicase SUPV3L1/SUV3